MKGYKAFIEKDGKLYCRGYEYKLNEINVHDGEVIPSVSGFHFCRNINSCYRYYHLATPNLVICEIEASGDIIKSHGIIDKYACSRLKILKKLNLSEMIEHLNEWNSGLLCFLKDNFNDLDLHKTAKNLFSLENLIACKEYLNVKIDCTEKCITNYNDLKRIIIAFDVEITEELLYNIISKLGNSAIELYKDFPQYKDLYLKVFKPYFESSEFSYVRWVYLNQNDVFFIELDTLNQSTLYGIACINLEMCDKVIGHIHNNFYRKKLFEKYA